MKMKAKEIPGRIAYQTVKEIANFTAPLTAVASMGGEGDGYLDNFKAVYEVPRQLFEVGSSFVRNEGIRDFALDKVGDLASLVKNGAENLIERPVETAIAAGIVYGVTRFTPHAIKGVSKLFERGSKNDIT